MRGRITPPARTTVARLAIYCKHTELAGSAPSTPIRMPRKPFRVLIVYAVFLKKSIGK